VGVTVEVDNKLEDDGSRRRGRGDLGLLLIDVIWVPSGLVVYAGIFMISALLDTWEYVDQFQICLLAAVALGWVIATLAVWARRRRGVAGLGRSFLKVLGAPARGWVFLCRRLLGGFISLVVTVSGVIFGIGVLIFLVFGVIGFRFGFNQFGMWTRGVNPVMAVVIVLVALVVFGLWCLSIIVSMVPFYLGSILVIGLSQEAGLVPDLLSGDDWPLYALVLVLGLFIWAPSCLTWTIRQLYPLPDDEEFDGGCDEDDVLRLPRTAIRGSNGSVDVRPSAGAYILTIVLFVIMWLVSTPLGPRRNLVYDLF
jgi:hypothetical protein